MGSGWKPIKIYKTLDGVGIGKPTREQVESMLNSTDPDAVESAGRSLVKAAELLNGTGQDAGLRGALRKAAEDLAEAWSGPAAAKAQEALRSLYATTDSLGEAMRATGEPLQEYAGRLRHYRANMPGQSTSNSDARPGEPAPSPGPPPVTDEHFQEHLRRLNSEVIGLNARLPDGVAYDLPQIGSYAIELPDAPPIDTGSDPDLPVTVDDVAWSGSASATYTGGTGPYGTAGPEGDPSTLTPPGEGGNSDAPGIDIGENGEVPSVIGDDTRLSGTPVVPTGPSIVPPVLTTAPTSPTPTVTPPLMANVLPPTGVIGAENRNEGKDTHSRNAEYRNTEHQDADLPTLGITQDVGSTGTGNTETGIPRGNWTGFGGPRTGYGSGGDNVTAPPLIGAGRETGGEIRPFPFMPMMGGMGAGGAGGGGGGEHDRTFFYSEPEAWRFSDSEAGSGRIG